MNDGTIGIVGGMGPVAGIHFAQQLIALATDAKKDAHHVPFILYSDPRIPDRSEAFLHQAPCPVPFIVQSLEKLSNSGADFGVIICNTAHIYFDEIVAQVQMPILNMVQNVVDHVANMQTRKKIGLLATTATVKSDLYAKHFKDIDIEIIAPSDSDQALIFNAIFHADFGIKSTGLVISPMARQIIGEVAQRMQQQCGIEYLLLGCTELSFAITGDTWQQFKIIDPVKILAQACITKSAKAIRQQRRRAAPSPF